MRTRQTVAQQPPDPSGDYTGFPARTVRAGTVWYRHHRDDQGPWWFTNTLQGRFDLPAPDGTCYLADSQQVAARERVGPDLAAAGRVAASVVTGRIVSKLFLPHTIVAANLGSDSAANHSGVTGELAVMVGYVVPQAWAQTLWAAGFGGILARLRFTPSAQRQLALFGPAGPRPDWPVDSQPTPLADIAARMRIDVVDPPHTDQITIVDKPNG